MNAAKDYGDTQPEPHAQAPQRPETLIFSLLKRAWGTFTIAASACVLNGIAGVLLVTTLNRALAQPSSIDRGLVWRFAICAIAALATRVASGVLFGRLAQDTMAQMRERVARDVAAAQLHDVERIGPAPVQSILTDDATNVSMLFFALPNIVMHGSIVLGCLAYLAWLSWPVFVLASAAILVGSVGYYIGDRRAIVALQAGGRAQDKLFAHLGELFAGAKELKLHEARARQFVDGQLRSTICEMRDYRRRGFSWYAIAVGWMIFIFYAYLGAAAFWAALGVRSDAAAAGSYVVVFLFLLVPLDGLLNNLPTINTARVSLQRIGSVMAQLGNLRLEPPPAGSHRCRLFGTLTLRGITHSYFRDGDERRFRIGPVHLTFKSGELTFIVGGNGSGKTTLAKLLVGLYEPESGVIELDGRPVLDAAARAAYRQYFTAVFSDFHLFDTLLGIVDPTTLACAEVDARANVLLAKLALDHKVRVTDGMFSTRSLSSGQRKRLALVVAYLEDRPFYLFDEWAADQDPAFKAVFYEQLLPELRARGKTVVVISHDDRYFALADRVLKLEDGRIVSDARGAVSRVVPAVANGADE